METPLGYSHDSETDVVTVRLTKSDFDALLFCLGIAAGARPEFQSMSLRIANAVNAGRPLTEWRPYTVLEDLSETKQ